MATTYTAVIVRPRDGEPFVAYQKVVPGVNQVITYDSMTTSYVDETGGNIAMPTVCEIELIGASSDQIVTVAMP